MTSNELIDECSHCSGGDPCRGFARYPRWFRKDLFLCFQCWDAFYKGDHIKKAMLKKSRVL